MASGVPDVHLRHQCRRRPAVAGLYARPGMSDQTHLLLATGLLGGFSTFSTMMNESVNALRAGRIAVFAGYMAASVIAPVAAVALGYLIAV